MRGSTALLIALVCLLSGLVGLSELRAQESIFDPENTDFPEESETEAPQGSEDSSGLIFDPENPDAFDDEPAQRAPTTAPAVFQHTQWGLDYELGTLIGLPTSLARQDNVELVGRLGLQLRHELSEETRIVLSGSFRYWAGTGERFDNWRTFYEPRLDRAYLVHRPGRWSFAFGQMRNSWGSTDLIRPGDVIDPVDMRSFVGGEALAQLSATAGYSGRDWSVRAVVVPFFQSNQFTLFGRDTALVQERVPLIGEQLPFLLILEELIDPSVQPYMQSTLVTTRRPLDLPQNASLGLRGTRTIEGTDLGLGAFFGWDRTPWVHLDDDLRALMSAGFNGGDPEGVENGQRTNESTEDLFYSEYRRRLTVLADFARYFGPLGVRADVAFSPRQVFYTTELEAVWRSSVFSALGLSHERLLGGERPLTLTAEGFWLLPLSPDSLIHRAFVPAGQGGRAEDELLIFEGGYYGIATAASWHTPWWNMELFGGGIATIRPGDLIAQLGANFRVRPGLHLRTGANLFFGPEPRERLSLGGLYAHNNRVYLLVGGQF